MKRMGGFKKFGDENVREGLVTPKDRIYSPSMNKRRGKMMKKMKMMKGM